MLICRSSRTNMLMGCPICGPQNIRNRRRKLRKKTPRVCVLFELSIFPDVRLAQAAVKSSRTSQRCHKEGPEMRPRASQKHFAEHFFAIFGRHCAIFLQLLGQKPCPGGDAFGILWQAVVLPKSCSRCSGSTIFKGRALEQSVRRATQNGRSAKHRRKALPTPSANVLFQSRARFPSIFGSPRASPKTPLSHQWGVSGVRTPPTQGL